MKKETVEPSISLSDELVLRNFDALLHRGQNDAAISDALMLTYAFAKRTRDTDEEYLLYQNATLKAVRKSVGSPDVVTSESTMGAIVLLAGIEVRFLVHRSGHASQQTRLHSDAGTTRNVVSSTAPYGGDTAASQDVSKQRCASER